MTVIMVAVVVGVLLGGGTYLILREAPINLVIGLTLLSYGVNLLLFTSSRLQDLLPPIVDKKATPDPEAIADPLPQALILTAIVISFAVTAFTVILVNRRLDLGMGSVADTDGRPDSPEHECTAEASANGEARSVSDPTDDDAEDYEWLELADNRRGEPS
ncbi:MAG: Na+/H+ antiporter subunit C [Actinomycetota bacterium]